MTDYAYVFDSHRQLIEAFLASAAAGDDMAGVITALNESPFLVRMIAAAGYERVGLQLHRRGKVEGEFTTCMREGRLLSVERGIDDVEFTIRIDLDVWDRINIPEESEWVKSNPIQAARKYWKHIEMPFMVKMKLGAKLLTG